MLFLDDSVHWSGSLFSSNCGECKQFQCPQSTSRPRLPTATSIGTPPTLPVQKLHLWQTWFCTEALPSAPALSLLFLTGLPRWPWTWLTSLPYLGLSMEPVTTTPALTLHSDRGHSPITASLWSVLPAQQPCSLHSPTNLPGATLSFPPPLVAANAGQCVQKRFSSTRMELGETRYTLFITLNF